MNFRSAKVSWGLNMVRRPLHPRMSHERTSSSFARCSNCRNTPWLMCTAFGVGSNISGFATMRNSRIYYSMSVA